MSLPLSASSYYEQIQKIRQKNNMNNTNQLGERVDWGGIKI